MTFHDLPQTTAARLRVVHDSAQFEAGRSRLSYVRKLRIAWKSFFALGRYLFIGNDLCPFTIACLLTLAPPKRYALSECSVRGHATPWRYKDDDFHICRGRKHRRREMSLCPDQMRNGQGMVIKGCPKAAPSSNA